MTQDYKDCFYDDCPFGCEGYVTKCPAYEQSDFLKSMDAETKLRLLGELHSVRNTSNLSKRICRECGNDWPCTTKQIAGPSKTPKEYTDQYDGFKNKSGGDGWLLIISLAALAGVVLYLLVG